MALTAAQKLYEMATIQIVAESYIDLSPEFGGSRSLDLVLGAGSNHLVKNLGGTGATRMTLQQVDWFKSTYDIVTHLPNDPASGFSATVVRNRTTGEYVLSFRSTEYQYQAQGGDYEADGSSAVDGEIASDGLGLPQLAAMEAMWEHIRNGEIYRITGRDAQDRPTGEWVSDSAGQLTALRNGSAPLTVTGYSLGGHMATAFTLLHADQVAKTYTFNGAGLGGIANEPTLGGNSAWRAPSAIELAQAIRSYREMIAFD